jgi:DNA polymerase (family X)
MSTRAGDRAHVPSNAEVAERLRDIADLLDLQGERFKPEAYRRASRSIESLAEGLDAVARRGELRTIPGVGDAIEEKVQEFLRTGKLAYYDRLKGEVPAGLIDLMRRPGLGPKTARRFWVELGIEGPEQLKAAIEAGRLQGVKGFGDRKIEQLRAALAGAEPAAGGSRLPLESVYPLAQRIAQALRTGSPARDVAIAGSFRRGRETVGDLDILVTSDEPARVFEVFSALPEVGEVRMRGGTKETVTLKNGLQVDLRVVEPAEFGAALLYFTGSKDHNVRLRSLARERGLKINEYGIFRGEARVGGATEEEVYAALGLRWIPPELREDRSEIDAARDGTLPHLVEASDLVGEFHAHLPEAATLDDLDRLLANAGARRLAYVGLVVGGMRESGSVWAIPDEVRSAARARAQGGVRLVPVAEVSPGPVPEPVLGLEPEYLILRPAATVVGPRPRADAIPVRLVAHLRPASPDLRTWLDLARAARAAIEVGPGPERLDSTAARSARESGVPLVLPLGLDEAPDTPTREVAIAFARRAGARPEDVANARALPAPKAGRTRMRR